MCIYEKRFMAWWRRRRTPLIPALGRQGQAHLWVWGHPSLPREFQDSWDCYTENPCLGILEQNKQKQNKKQKEIYKDLLGLERWLSTQRCLLPSWWLEFGAQDPHSKRSEVPPIRLSFNLYTHHGLGASQSTNIYTNVETHTSNK